MKWIKDRLIDRTFLKSPKPYIVQSLLAIVAVTIMLYFVEILTHAAIVAALGASVFIVFAMPNTIAADPRRIIGGHIIGVLCGILCYYVFCAGPIGGFFEATEPIRWFPAALSVGLAIFLMSIFNFEHPPAAGTAIGIVTHEWSHLTVIFVIVFAVSLAIVKVLLRKYLKDLYT
jgi:CBS-domain-containing membrane protein